MGSGGRNECHRHLLAGLARRKFFMNSKYIMSRNKEKNVFGLRRPTESNRHLLAVSARRKFFMKSKYIMSRKWESNVFALKRTK